MLFYHYYNLGTSITSTHKLINYLKCVQFSGSCWHDRYEFHSWSNVLCVLRDDPWHQAITPYILLPASTLLPEGFLIRFSDSPTVYRIDGRLKNDSLETEKYS